MIRALIGIALLVAFAGCSSWSGKSEIQLQDGTRLRCHGLRFSKTEVTCSTAQGDINLAWSNVVGYATGSFVSP